MLCGYSRLLDVVNCSYYDVADLHHRDFVQSVVISGFNVPQPCNVSRDLFAPLALLQSTVWV